MPWRSAVFICVSQVPPLQVYQVLLAVVSTLTRLKLKPELAYAAFSTAIWLLICVVVGAP